MRLFRASRASKEIQRQKTQPFTGNLIQVSTMFGPASCLSTPEGCFCEAFQSGAILQPINSITSLAFAVLGVFLLGFYFQRNKSLYQQCFWLLFVFSLLTTGFGSAYYHARLDLLGQTLDFLGMFMILLSGPLLSFNQGKRYGRRKTIFLYCAVASACLALLILIPEVRRYVFGIGVVLILAAEIRSKYAQKHDFLLALITFLFSFLFWIPDNYLILCFTGTNYQLHALWHLLNTLACYFLFRYYYQKYSDVVFKGQ